MKKSVSLVVLAAALFVSLVSFAQANKSENQQESNVSPGPQKFYKLDYVLRELDGSKEISKRNYTISVRSGNSFRQIRTGTRVPVMTEAPIAGHQQFQYMDVGVNIDTQTREEGGVTWLEVTGDLTSIAKDETRSESQYSPPLVRQAKIAATVQVNPGKPVLVFSADEPTSSRRFELTVTATQLR